MRQNFVLWALILVLPLLIYFNLQPFSLLPLGVLLASMVFWSVALVRCGGWRDIRLSYLQLLVLWATTRFLSLFAGEPSVDDDVYRYLWDGARWICDGEPFSGPPLSRFDQALPADMSWLADRMNYPGLATIYGPLWVMIGSVAWTLSPTTLIGWKTLSILFELALLIGTRCMVSRGALFAWLTCPIVFWEIHLQCHAEVFALGFWLLAMAKVRRGQFFLAGLFLSLAIGGRWSMVVPVGLACLSCRCDQDNRRRLVFGGAFGAALLGALLLTMGPFNLTGFRALAEDWVFNPIVWKWFPEQPSIVWILGLGLFLLLYQRPWKYQIDNLELWSILFAVWLVVSPVVNPWYLLWLVPGFIAIHAWSWWSLWLAAIPIAYLQAQWMGDLDHPKGLHHHPDIVWWAQAGVMSWIGLRGAWLAYRRTKGGS